MTAAMKERHARIAATPIAKVIASEAATLVAMQRRLFDAGLLASAAAVNAAANAIGWEGASLLEVERVKAIPAKCPASASGKHKLFNLHWCEHCGEELGPNWPKP